MLSMFIFGLVLLVAGLFTLQFFLKLRSIRAAETTTARTLSADRYRPMLRLLCDGDMAFVSVDVKLQKQLRARRRDLFRGYLRCLIRDYAHLLAGVREAMVHSDVDRPDLARALAKNRVFFALAICKVEFHLALHATGAVSVDISALVNALETLRAQVEVLSSAVRVQAGAAQTA
jgi:hypothetical protein